MTREHHSLPVPGSGLLREEGREARPSILRDDGEESSSERPPTTSRSRGWCFTWFGGPNPNALHQITRDELSERRPVVMNVLAGRAHYAIIGIEICPKEKKPHYQGYMNFKSATTFKGAKKLLGEAMDQTVHIEKAIGTALQNRTYCSKDGDFVEIGKTPVGMGKRTDLDTFYERLVKGDDLSDIALDNPGTFIKYHSGLEKFNQILNRKKMRIGKPIIIWCHGPSGSGKSMWAHWWAAENPPWCSVEYDGKFWNGLETDAHTIIVDDFRPDTMPFATLLKLCDKYRFNMNIKGSNTQLRAKYIIITTLYDYKRTYGPHSSEPLEQLARRIKHHVKFPLDESQEKYKIPEPELERLLMEENDIEDPFA